MTRAGRTMQINILIQIIKCGLVGYGVWKTYKTNGEWLQTKFNFLTGKLSLTE